MSTHTFPRQQALIRGLVKSIYLLGPGPFTRLQVCKVAALHQRGQLGLIYAGSYLPCAAELQQAPVN